MGLLVLVRHGQASFLADDYDKLSPIGEDQARRLGRFWVTQGVVFDHVFTGPLFRQIRTAEIVGQEFRAAGGEWPDPEVLSGLAEYDGSAAMRTLLPLLCDHDIRVRELSLAYEASRGTPEEPKAFQRIFEAVTNAWIADQIHAPGLLRWSDFKHQVREGVGRMVNGGGSGRRIAAFTSGGPTSVVVQMALDISDEKTIELNWQIRNSALTELLFSKERLTLDRFNALPHLPDISEWTYR